jgi:hypothetical protein
MNNPQLFYTIKVLDLDTEKEILIMNSNNHIIILKTDEFINKKIKVSLSMFEDESKPLEFVFNLKSEE